MSEKKDIANLDFNIKGALDNLDKIDKKLKDIADSSDKYSKKIGKNISDNNMNFGEVDLKQIDKNLSDVSKMSKTKQDQLSAQLVKIKAKEQSDINEIVAKGEEKRKTMAYKASLEQQKNNEELLSSTKTLSDKISEYAKTFLIYQGFNALKKGIKETIDEMVNVEYQMVQIDRVLNDSSLNINNYRDKLMQLAYDYGNSFENVADITLRLAQAGFDAKESIALTEKTLLALNTAELDATQATSEMVAVMAQWGLMTGDAQKEAKDYGEIIDKINKVADNFPTTSADILEALKKTSSAFNLAGASIDETIATIVAAETASQRGGKVIGTALSNIVQQLKAEKKLDLAEELGLNFFEDNAKTKFKPIMEIFEEMSNRMQKLKNEGKESSTEMQSLLEMFTVFRRNIGASLLGEMSGEDSTYAKVLETSLNSVGYSLEENEKHMKTAKAAQAQFNAELLKLKTEVWDEGLEDVFRNMLQMGTNLIDGIGKIIDKVGLLPTSIGAVTLAFTTLNKSTRAGNYIEAIPKIKELNNLYKEYKGSIEGNADAQIKYNGIIKGTSTEFKKYSKNIKEGKISLKGYAGSLAATTVKTALMTAATVALQAAISAGITLAISALVAGIENWIHADEKAIEKNKELMQTANDNADKLNQEKESIAGLRKEYEELSKKEKRTPEENQRIYELQEKLNNLIEDSGKQVELVTKKVNDQGKAVTEVNKNYREQIQLIKEVEREKQAKEVKELKEAAEAAEKLKTPMKTDTFFDFWGGIESQIKDFGGGLEKFYKEINSMQGFPDSQQKYGLSWIENLDFDKQIELLSQWRNELERSEKKGKDVSKALDWVKESLDGLEGKQKTANEAIEKYNDALRELYDMSGLITDYQQVLNGILNTYGENESVKNLANDLTNLNKRFEEGEITTVQYFDNIKSKIDSIDFKDKSEKELEGLRAIFAETTRFIAESIEDIQNTYDEGNSSFKEYTEGLSKANENLLELYATENDLQFKQGEGWTGANQAAAEYANQLQDIQDKAESYIGVLDTLGESYEYIKENADAFGNAAFEAKDTADKEYQNLVVSLSNSLNAIRDNNRETFDSITQNIADNIGISTNEMLNASGYLDNGFLKQANNMNITLNAVAKQAQEATKNMATSTGNLISKLGETISNFKYDINFKVTGGVNPGGNLADLALGKTFKPTSDLKLSIDGNPVGAAADLGAALKDWGTNFNNYVTSKNQLGSLLDTIKPYTPYKGKNTSGSGNYKPGGSGKGSRGGGGSHRDTSDRDAEMARRDAERAAREAQKAEEEAYKKRLKQFTDYLKEKERAETRWVKKQKELGLLTNKDFLYITQERIKRNEKYLNEIQKQTWLKAEDRLKLEKEYSEKIEDLQLSYMGYLKDKLDDDIKALENANDEKIKLIEEEADKRINALKKVEKENDRIRAKEDYEKRRKEHLTDISYWEQRTGREAQEALKEAKKNLNELDEDWKKQKEDWSNEDQIKKIEEERDAQIESIKKMQEEQIEAWKQAYEAKVKLFGETGQIIYENTIIQSQALYEAYKKNFVDPISNDLNNLSSQIAPPKPAPAPAPAPKPEQQYETYLIKYGDTLSGIAGRFGTSIEKIMAANPYVKNKNRIYAGKTLQIPKFHEGGIVGGNKEAFALLKPNEVILKPEWAEGINKLAKMAKNEKSPINNSTVIEVKGDLVKIDAKIKDKTDAEFLTRKVEKMLKDKFNIKK